MPRHGLEDLQRFIRTVLTDGDAITDAEILDALDAEFQEGATADATDGRLAISHRLLGRIENGLKRGIVDDALRMARYYGRTIPR